MEKKKNQGEDYWEGSGWKLYKVLWDWVSEKKACEVRDKGEEVTR